MLSRTAVNMAAFRALEAARPSRDRLFTDAYAARFLSPLQRLLVALSRAPMLRRIIEAYADARAPGARSSGIARTRLIDDWLIQACRDGAEQVVILGAGYDCRALRLPELAHLPTFELDRAELLNRKSKRIGDAPKRLVRLPIDFLKETVRERLIAGGFDPTKPSVFLWEGVTNYLDEAAVSAVLDTVAAMKGRIIFTYIHADAVTGRFDAPGLRTLLRRLRRIGEPWTFGLKPEELPHFLNDHGLKLCSDLGAASYRALYGRGDSAHRVGYEFYRVAFAESL